MGLTPTVLSGLSGAVTNDVPYSNADPWVSLHTADPGTAGIYEVTSGTGADGRQRPTMTGTATRRNSNVTSIEVAATPTRQIRWIGLWTAQTGGTFLGGFPLVGPLQAAASAASSATVHLATNPFTVGEAVRCYSLPGVPNSAVPTGVTEDDTYYVVASTASTLQVSATRTGSPITLVVAAAFGIALDQSQSFTSTGALTFPVNGIVYETAA